jgi:hypothetical protein
VPVIPALGRQKQEDNKFEVSLGHMLRPCLNKNKNNSNNNHKLFHSSFQQLIFLNLKNLKKNTVCHEQVELIPGIKD